MSATTMNIRVDSEIKDTAKKIFAELGLDLTTAVNIFLRQAIRENGIPFDLTLDAPNEETKRAIREAERGINMSQTFSSTKELLAEVETNKRSNL